MQLSAASAISRWSRIWCMRLARKQSIAQLSAGEWTTITASACIQRSTIVLQSQQAGQPIQAVCADTEHLASCEGSAHKGRWSWGAMDTCIRRRFTLRPWHHSAGGIACGRHFAGTWHSLGPELAGTIPYVAKLYLACWYFIWQGASRGGSYTSVTSVAGGKGWSVRFGVCDILIPVLQ